MGFQINHQGSIYQPSKIRVFFLFGSFFIFLFGFSHDLFSEQNRTLSIMAYNVENLFDATDDGEWQGDPTFLPLSVKREWTENKCLVKKDFRRYLCETLDWTQSKYEKRLKKVASVLLGYDHGGADIIVLEELENKRVIVDLWLKHLRQAGYRFPIHFESPSNRGIDVGILSRFPLASPPIVHQVDLSGIDPNPTRDIIEVTLKVSSNQKLRVAANHWPSQNHVVEARQRAADVIKRIVFRAQEEGIVFVAVGDFNTLSSEKPNPIENNLADHLIRNLKCPMVDLQDYLGGYANFHEKGSHFYKGEWSPLDRILVSKNFFHGRSSMAIDLSSFGLYVPNYLLKSDYMTDPRTGEKRLYTFPHRYDFLTDDGYSDHLPVVLKINLRGAIY